MGCRYLFTIEFVCHYRCTLAEILISHIYAMKIFKVIRYNEITISFTPAEID